MKKLSIILICGLLAAPIQALTFSSFTSFFKQHWGKMALAAGIGGLLYYYLKKNKTESIHINNYTFNLEFINKCQGCVLVDNEGSEGEWQITAKSKLEKLYEKSGEENEKDHMKYLDSLKDNQKLIENYNNHKDDKSKIITENVINTIYGFFPNIDTISQKYTSGKPAFDNFAIFCKKGIAKIRESIYTQYSDEDDLNSLPEICKAYIFYKIASKYMVYMSYPYSGITHRFHIEKIPFDEFGDCFNKGFYKTNTYTYFTINDGRNFIPGKFSVKHDAMVKEMFK